MSLLLEDEEPDYRQILKYSNALTTALHHRLPNGEASALLDLHPWSNCNEESIVQNYVDSAPLRKRKKKRRQCPIDASVLFRNNGPHITGEANMNAIGVYERNKAEKAAAKEERKLKRTRDRARKRQDATMEVVKMAVQQLLTNQTPPLKYYDASGDAVTRLFKPNFHDCKRFMQVSEGIWGS